MSDESPTGQQAASDKKPTRILLVTGLLGAGKTTALRALEDLGWEPVDNFPVRLLPRLVSTAPGPGHERSGDEGDPLAIGFDSRTRGFDPQRVISEVTALGKKDDITISTLFLDCGSE